MLKSYQKFVVDNQVWYLPVLDMARWFSVFLPGRFQSDLSSEALYSLLNIAAFFHDRMLNRDERPVCRYRLTGPRKGGEETAMNILSIFHFSEVLLEMIAIKKLTEPTTLRTQTLFSSAQPVTQLHRKWYAIFVIEACKASANLFLLYRNGGRTLVQFTEKDVMEEIARKKGEEFLEKVGEAEKEVPNKDLLEMYVKHGRCSTPHGSFEEVKKHDRELKNFKPSAREIIAETFHQLRPILYVISRIICAKTGRSRWLPFFMSLSMDIGTKLMALRHMEQFSVSEVGEQTKRILKMLMYSICDPFFDTFMLGPILSLRNFFGKIPFFGTMIQMVIDLLVSLQSLHFYQRSGC